MSITMTSTFQKRKLVSGIARWSRAVVIFVAILNYMHWEMNHPAGTTFNRVSYGLFAVILGLQIFMKSGAGTLRVFGEIVIENFLITLGVVINPLNFAFFILYFVVLYRCGRSLPVIKGLLCVFLTALFQVVGIVVWGKFGYLSAEHVLQYIYHLAFELPGWLLVFGAGWMLRIQTEVGEQTHALLVENQAQKEALERAHAELLKYALEVEEATVLRERNRLASEIHDTVGHALTSVIRSTDACVELLQEPASGDRVARHLKAMRMIAQESLTEVRHSVRELASETSWVGDWEAVLRRFAEHVYELANTTVHIEGIVAIPVLERYTVYQCIKEAVTNSIRHGKAQKINVCQIKTENGYRIEIYDNGIGVDTIHPSFGLHSIETRMRNIGGHAVFRSIPGDGFYVVLWKGDDGHV